MATHLDRMLAARQQSCRHAEPNLALTCDGSGSLSVQVTVLQQAACLMPAVMGAQPQDQ